MSTSDKVYDGDFTFCINGRKSQVDICLENDSALEFLKAFATHRISCNFSDHAPISTSLDFDINLSIPTNEILSDILTSNGCHTETRPRRLPTNVNWKAYVKTASKDLTSLILRMKSII